ncbi:hypothetical protein B0H34DRAFT_157935 [Crassisporium funariophilum]|nr:hypothetical protein B0H34DRAFT_157935 [Crassisporium funariophilum]
MPRLLARMKNWHLKIKAVIPREGTDVSEHELSPLSLEFQVYRPTIDDAEDQDEVFTDSKQPVTISHSADTTSLDKQGRYRTSSGIATLPVELLKEIFVIYTFANSEISSRGPFAPIPSKSRAPYCFIPHKSHGPLLLCSISSHWRQVALTTPSLWSSLFVRQYPDLNLISLWLERSRSYPLTLGLASKTMRYKIPEEFRFTEAVLLLFATQLHRWRQIMFHLPNVTVKAFLDLPLPTATVLDNACVFTDSGDLEVSQAIFAALSSCPNLQHLVWSGDNRVSPIAKNIFWSQLTSIELQCMLSMSEYVTLLQHCSNASRVIVEGMSDTLMQKDYPHTTLPHLQELILEHSGWDFNKLLEHITMPALQYLSFGRCFSGTWHNSLRAFLDRSACRLEKLSVVDKFLGRDDVATLFQDPVICAIPRASFICSSLLDIESLISDLQNRRLNSTPPFGKDYRNGFGIYIGWGKPCFLLTNPHTGIN